MLRAAFWEQARKQGTTPQSTPPGVLCRACWAMRKKKKRGKRPYRQPLGSKHCAAEALATSIVAIDFWKREKKHLNVGGLDPANVKARDATLSALRDGTHSSLGLLSEECHASAASSAECSCRKICIRCPCETCVASPSRGLFAKKKLNLVLHHDRYEITGPQSTVPCERAKCKHCLKYTRRIAQQARAVSGAQAVAIAEDANSSNSDIDVFDDAWSILPPPSSEGAAELPSRCDSPEEVANKYSRYLPAHTGFVVGSKIGDAVSQDGLPSGWTEGASTESINFLIPKLPPAEAQPPMPLPSKGSGSDDTDTASGSMSPLAHDDYDDDDAAFSHMLQHDFDPYVAHETLAEHLHSIDQIALQFTMEQAPPALVNRLAVQVAEMRTLLLSSLDQRPAMETDDVAGSRGRTQYTGLRRGAGSRDDGVEGKANREFCKAHLKHLGVGALVVARTVRGVEEKGETLSSKYSGVNEEREMGVPMKGACGVRKKEPPVPLFSLSLSLSLCVSLLPLLPSPHRNSLPPSHSLSSPPSLSLSLPRPSCADSGATPRWHLPGASCRGERKQIRARDVLARCVLPPAAIPQQADFSRPPRVPHSSLPRNSHRSPRSRSMGA